MTKGCYRQPRAARAILAGGVAQLADSRLANVQRLRDAAIDAVGPASWSTRKHLAEHRVLPLGDGVTEMLVRIVAEAGL